MERDSDKPLDWMDLYVVSEESLDLSGSCLKIGLNYSKTAKFEVDVRSWRGKVASDEWEKVTAEWPSGSQKIQNLRVALVGSVVRWLGYILKQSSRSTWLLGVSYFAKGYLVPVVLAPLTKQTSIELGALPYW